MDAAKSLSPPRPVLMTRPPATPQTGPVAEHTRPSATPGPSTASSVRRSSSAATNEMARMRQASVDRLLTQWDQLLRHQTPLEEDDIVDLRDLSVVKDRGVMRGMRRRIFSPTTQREASAGPEAEEDDGPEPVLEFKSYVPPAPLAATKLLPEDALLLNEFEVEEKKARTHETWSAGDVEGLDEAEEEGNSDQEEDEDEDEDSALDPEFTVAEKPNLEAQPRGPVPPRTDDIWAEDEFESWDFDAEGLPPAPQSRTGFNAPKKVVRPVSPLETPSSKHARPSESSSELTKLTRSSLDPPSRPTKRQRISRS